MARQLAFDLGHRPALGREDFLVAPCNRDAVAWLDRWPDWPAPALLLTGPHGAGKTHLAGAWRVRSRAVALDPATLDREHLADRLGDARAALVDGAETADERVLLHLYNMLAERRGHLLLTAAQSPARWPVALADLRSRLLAAPLVELGAPDDALLGGLLVKLFADRQLIVGEGVPGFLLSRLERSFDAARAAVDALDRASLADRRPVTVPFARAVLGAALDGA